MNDVAAPARVALIPQKELSCTLIITPEILTLISSGRTYIQVAQAYEITDADTAQQAASELAACNRAVDQITARRKKFLEPAKQIVDEANALFNPGIEGFQNAADLLKTRLKTWTVQEEKRIALENLQREEAARKVRQEAEQKAAAEIARAEQNAATARRQAEEAEVARKKAEAEGNTRAAAAAAAEVAKANERAQAAIETGTAKATEAHMTATAAVQQAAPEQQAKISGFSTRENWTCRLLKNITEDQAKAQIAAEAVARPELLAFLTLDEKALKNAAKTYKRAFNVPGYEAFNDPIAAGSRK